MKLSHMRLVDPACGRAKSAQTCPRAKPNETNLAANVVVWSLGGESTGGGGVSPVGEFGSWENYKMSRIMRAPH